MWTLPDGRVVDPITLEQELGQAGIDARGLGFDGAEVHTYAEDGTPRALPEQAQAVINAHQAQPRPTREERRAARLQAIERAGSVAALRTAVVEALQDL
jgi:hypothetical protein